MASGNGHANQHVNNRGDVWQQKATELSRKLEMAEAKLAEFERAGDQSVRGAVRSSKGKS